MIIEKIKNMIGQLECIREIEPQIDILENGGISIEPVEDRVIKKYVGGDEVCEFEFYVAVNADFFREDIRKVYVFFETFKAQLASCEMTELSENENALSVTQEGAFEMRRLSAVQMKYAVKCKLTYYKRGE